MRRKKALRAKQSKQHCFDFGGGLPSPTPPRFAHPRNDNERLLNAQADILEGKVSGWRTFYKLATRVALRYVAAIAKTNPAVASLDESERYEKAHDAVVYLCEGYLSDDSFCIQKSITGYLWLRVRASLFNHTKAESIVDFVDMETLLNMVGEK